MSGDLFAKEMSVAERAEGVLAAEDGEVPREEMEAVLKGYKKLLRQTRKLMRISDRSEAELTRIAKALDEKNAVLQDLSVKLSKYLSPQIYQLIFSGERDVSIATERKKLTVFFSDIKDFTLTTEDMQPEDLTALLNHYLTEMSEIALRYGATIDKYIGDAMLMFFGDPETKGVREDARLCVAMALEMQARMQELAEDWRDQGYEQPFQMRIGINTGFCNVGNFGSDARMDYTIIGGEVNLAARLEGIAEPGGVALSHETYLLVKDMVSAEALEPITVKGIRRPVTPYRVTESKTNGQADAPVIRAAVHGFRLFADLQKLNGEARKSAVKELKSALKRLAP